MTTGAPYSGPPLTGPPLTGPPAYGPPAYGPPAYGSQAPWAPPPYGFPAPWGPGAPREPRRPGQVTAAAVLSFVQAALVLIATLYLWLLVSLGRLAARTLRGPSGGGPLVAEGTVLAIVQLVSVAVLVAAGVFALSRRSRPAWVVVLVAFVAQVALAGYWATRLPTLLSAQLSDGVPDPGVAMFAVVFAAGPLVALGLVLVAPARAWFDGTPRP